MLNGMVAAEAVDLVLCADIRTGHAASDIWFSYGYTGNTAYAGANWLLPRMVGLSEASRILLTAERVTGTRAHQLGLITTLVDRENLESETMALAERIVGLPPITLRLIKKEIHRGYEIGSFHSNLDVMSMIEPIVQFTQDHMDAENAILEKRKPVVKGF
jgi:2-(1,2-epoxy-1,2-dihydrophenyl)acetyl-CoA isomerase